MNNTDSSLGDKRPAEGTSENPDDKGKPKTKTVVKISISTKYLSGTYSEKASGTIFPFYNDLKIAYMTRIKNIPIGCKEYIHLSDMFKFTIDLILREGVRLSLLTPEEIAGHSETSEEPSKLINGKVPPETKLKEQALADLEEEYDSEVLIGFQKIYSDVVEQYGEAFIIYTKNGPLFTSLDGKALLDQRDTLPGRPGQTHIPGTSNLNTTKILPQVAPLTSYQMAYISPIVSAVPHPAIPPTVLMSGFTHPNAVPLPTSRWINYEENQSFSPNIDGPNSLLDEDVVNSVWFEKYTQRRMVTDKALLKLLKSSDKEDVDMKDTSVDEKNETKKGSSEKEKEDDDGDANMKEASAEKTKNDTEVDDTSKKSDSKSTTDLSVELGELTGEDFVEALLWTPNHFIDDDEIEAAKNGDELELLSRLILELQEKQRQRLSRSDGREFFVVDDERRLANKVQNLLSRIIDESGITPHELGISIEPKYPVLQASYMGTLPIPPVPPQPTPASSGAVTGGNSSNSGKHGRYTPVRKRR